MEWFSARSKFSREIQTTWPIRLLLWGWISLACLSTLSLLFQQIPQHVPRWPWDVWLIGLLTISLIALFEGAFRYTQKLKGIYNPLVLARGLSALPVYRQDLRVELLDFHKGTTLDFTQTTIFAKLSITSADDTGITEMGLMCQHGESVYRGKPLSGLSGWIIKTPFHNPQYPYKSFEEQPLDTLSLWRELQTSGLKSGLMKTGWIGFVIPKRPVSGSQITSFGVDISRPQYKQPYRFRFRELTEQEDVTIFDRAFRED
jgi:hypothetical protein